MRNPKHLLSDKMKQLNLLIKEVRALELVIPMLEEEEVSAEIAAKEQSHES